MHDKRLACGEARVGRSRPGGSSPVVRDEPAGAEGGALRAAFLTLLAVLAVAAAIPAAAAADPHEPTPEPNFAVNALPRPCAYEGDDPWEKRLYQTEGWKGPDYDRYPGACQRMRFAYGPIHVKPGQNDVLIEPVTIEKPSQDGYITRI